MRAALINENIEQVKINDKYIMQITGDNQAGKNELDNFINPEEKYPVIATTSKLMTTGVDAQTCKLIVLDSNIASMTEFKQIIGRGTRINENFGKTFFTVMDFRGVTNLFADPDFDGEPVRIKEIGEDDLILPDEDEQIIDDNGEEIIFQPAEIIDAGDIIQEPSAKYFVNGVNVVILNERVQYLDVNGKLITASLKDYTRQKVREQYHSLDDFLQQWNASDKKQTIIEQLTEQGIVFADFKVAVDKEMDIFDLICHTAFDQPPLTRAERVRNVKKRDYFSKYGEQARKVLETLLDKYADEGIENIEDMKILQVNPLDALGSPLEIVGLFGGKIGYLQALGELELEIYRRVA
jgi:type I restriction enzyme R subunit